ncbi:MAG: proline--tRNA ligase [Candidatus Dadabacteria bacterium]|nr:MAG: proline--tRNA ligase [Candidatus Dadabacteria bacterium]
MRQSVYLCRTSKETPRDAQTAAHRLMLRAGYIRQLSAGIYSYLPLMLRVLTKISQIVREEMNRSGAQELLMPALQPKELWVESGRWERYTDIDGIMFAFQDRRKSMVCLGPTHEEVITDIVRKELNSYRDLPVNLYQIQNKFRDEIRPRFGLMRAREFIMKDAYSFDVDQEGLDRSFAEMEDAYHRICKRIGFKYRCVEADPGAIGGSGSKEFMVLADTGEDTILYCDNCDYAANQEKAESRLEEFEQDKEELPMEEVLGEGIIGVEPLAEFLGIPVWKTTKTLLYEADDQIVAVMVRGDCDVNEIKVANFLGCKRLELTSPEKIKELTGAEVGYAGPVGLPENIKVLADNYTRGRINFECGANKTNYHNINVNFGRDFPDPVFGDFKLAKAGDICPRCDGKLKEARGIEVGHIFKLGTKYSEAMNCNYLDSAGASKPMYMGCYGIGISRMAAAVIEQNHDEKGIIWPKAIAPFDVHLIGINLEDESVKNEAEKLYKQLKDDSVDVLYDDRSLRAGEKFSDADLIGIPCRITVSKKTIAANKIEVKLRSEKEARLLDYSETLELLKS